MSIDPHASAAYGPAPPKSGGGKIWLFVGLGCGGVVLLLCCGVGAGLFMFGRQASQMAEQPDLPQLAVGMISPEIEGEDVDGTPFKLSDYRGKVVMLDFWGNW